MNLFQDVSTVVLHGEYDTACFLLVLLTGCHSTQESYLAQVTDHATVAELGEVLRVPAMGKPSIQDNGSGSVTSREFQ